VAIDKQSPSIPTKLTSTAKTINSISISWAAATDNVQVTGYLVYVNNKLVATVTGTSYMATGLAPSTKYSFAVKAKDESGNVSGYSSAYGVTTNALPTAPTKLKVTGQQTNSVNITWAPSTGSSRISGYQIFRDGKPIATISGTSFTNTGLKPSTTYTYTIKAKDAAGNMSLASAQLKASTKMTPVSYEAESPNNTRKGTAIVVEKTKVDGVGNNKGTLQFNKVTVPSAGTYTLEITYTNGVRTMRKAQMSVNGVYAATYSFPFTGNWGKRNIYKTTVKLKAGANTIAFYNTSGPTPQFDRIQIK
jgi:chitodextrinase